MGVLIMTDTATELRREAREAQQAKQQQDRETAAVKLTAYAERHGASPEDLAEVLAALGLDGADGLPEGVCRRCGHPLPSDHRKLCRRTECVQARAAYERGQAEQEPGVEGPELEEDVSLWGQGDE
jgi:hypothetical protein